MKAVRAFGKHDLRVVDLPSPTLAQGEVMVSVKACGICGSDKWFWTVEEPTDYIAGHEVAGIVTAVGPGVRSLREGDRVAVNNVRGCGECTWCERGEFVLCPHPVVHMGQGFSELVAVPERNCLLLDDRLSFEEGCLIFDNWGTPYSALNRVKLEPGMLAVVSGCGPIGLAALALIRTQGVRVIAVDPLEERREAARKLGAESVLAPDDCLKDSILELSGSRGVNVFIECSGKSSAYPVAFSVLSPKGKLVCIGEGAEFTVGSSHLIHKHLTISASLYSSMQDGAAVQKLMLEGAIKPTALVTHRFRLEDLPSVFGEVVSGGSGILKTVVLMNGGEQPRD